MPSSTTLTVRLAPKVKRRLGSLAQRTRRTKSFLAGEAISSYVERELEIIEGIERSLSDMETGRVVSHEHAMRRIRATIARTQLQKRTQAQKAVTSSTRLSSRRDN